jgi:hypothetical protein
MMAVIFTEPIMASTVNSLPRGEWIGTVRNQRVHRVSA